MRREASTPLRLATVASTLPQVKRLGSLLMASGLLAGIVLGIGVIGGVKVDGVPLLVAIGLGKLTFVAALGLMAAGAGLRRIALRQEKRREELARSNERLNLSARDG